MSWYLPEKRALFLHIPRTGGTWVKEALHVSGIPLEKWGQMGPYYRPKKHTLLGHYRLEHLARVDYIFSFVRKPVDYLISVWRFTTRAHNIWPEKMRERVVEHRHPAWVINEAVVRWKPDFNEWLAEMLEEEPGWVTRWFERFVGPHHGEFCHFIGRTETLQEDMDQVMAILGYEDRWRRANEKILAIHHAKNKVRTVKAQLVEATDWQRELIERGERVMLRRFYGEQSESKRVYRSKVTGEPL